MKMKPANVILLAILGVVHFTLTAFAQKSEKNGTPPLYKFVVNKDKSVQVYDMQGNLIADKPTSEENRKDKLMAYDIIQSNESKIRDRPIRNEQPTHSINQVEVIQPTDYHGELNSSFADPNLFFYTGTGATNYYGYNYATNEITFVSSVGNNGNLASGDFVIGWHLSTDSAIETSDKLIDASLQSSLAAGIYRVNITSATVDLDNVSGLAYGTYYAGAILDGILVINESNENDNAYLYSGQVNFIKYPPYCNLYIYTGPGATNYYTYNSTSHVISFTSSVGNNGNETSFDFYIGWYLSFNTIISLSDFQITKWYELTTIGAGSHLNNISSIGVDLDNISGLPFGTYYVGAIVDIGLVDNNVELDETDNTFTYASTLSYINPYPNLYFDTFRATNTYSYNSSTQMISFASSVGNNGGVGSGNFNVGWYLSENTTISAEDYLITFSAQNSIQPSFVRDINSSVVDLDNISSLPSGTYYAGAFIDAYNLVTESDELDNTYLYSPTLSYTSSSDVKDDKEIPLAFELKQNYPNPFNPVTTIEYNLPEEAEVLMTMYDITGHVVRKYTPGHVKKGTHTLQWDGCDALGNRVAAGIYFYQIQAGSSNQGNLFQEVRKMILMK